MEWRVFLHSTRVYVVVVVTSVAVNVPLSSTVILNFLVESAVEDARMI